MCFLGPTEAAAVSISPGTPSGVMEGARTDLASLSHRAFLSGLREAERVRSPLLSPAPAAAWHPAGGCGQMPKCCSAHVQPCQAPLVLLNCDFSASVREKNPCEQVRMQLPDTLVFVLCAVIPVCHSCASG